MRAEKRKRRRARGADFSMPQPRWRCQILVVRCFKFERHSGARESANPESRDSGFASRPGMAVLVTPKKEARFRGPLSLRYISLTAMVMPVMVVSAAAAELNRLQLEAGDAGGDVQSGLPLHADRLQRVGIGRGADQENNAAAD